MGTRWAESCPGGWMGRGVWRLSHSQLLPHQLAACSSSWFILLPYEQLAPVSCGSRHLGFTATNFLVQNIKLETSLVSQAKKFITTHEVLKFSLFTSFSVHYHSMLVRNTMKICLIRVKKIVFYCQFPPLVYLPCWLICLLESSYLDSLLLEIFMRSHYQ